MDGSLVATNDSRTTPCVCGPDAGAVRAHLERVLASEAFAHAPAQQRFLRFVVEETLEGRGDALKEYVIGTAVLGRGPGFEPKGDSSVRVAARRLRQRLAEHYATHAGQDPLRIVLHAGSYQPAFFVNGPGATVAPGGTTPLTLPTTAGIVSVSLAGLTAGGTIAGAATAPGAGPPGLAFLPEGSFELSAAGASFSSATVCVPYSDAEVEGLGLDEQLLVLLHRKAGATD
jgi:hypothetical protein